MASLSRFLALSAFGALAAASFAQSYTGTWKGHFDLSGANIPKAANPQQQQMIDKQLSMVKSMVINLSLKANKTFTITVSGGMAPKPTVEAGTWTQAGKTITLSMKTHDGKPVSGPQAQPVTLTASANSKTLTLVPPGSNGHGKVVFTR